MVLPSTATTQEQRSSKILSMEQAIAKEKENISRKNARKLKSMTTMENLKDQIRSETAKPLSFQEKLAQSMKQGSNLNKLEGSLGGSLGGGKLGGLSKMLKPLSIKSMIGQYFDGVMIQSLNEKDEKDDVKEGIDQVKSKKLL